MEAEVPVWTNAKCHEKYTNIDIDNILICAGGSNKDTCNGDSGGPLMFNNNGNYEVIGIVSFGVVCGESSYPGVFTRVTSKYNMGSIS
ncbi:venom protease-like [Homarus americanus]|uniref:venom protease-like n=1 Tax=Homarus americanus TaxID=6706 RepID=UPI001C43A1E2|nr:venom protease-like [Homarus americanus]XP_042217565.1 venom protease-like [Homarus americanus]